MTRIYIIRHAEAEGNLFHRAHGWFDGHITATGMEQIAALEKRFADIHVDTAYASELTRTQTTAQAVVAPKGLKLRIEPGLNEIRMGVYEDVTLGDLIYHHPEERVNFGTYSRKWAPEGGDTFAQAAERFTAAFFRLAQRHPDETICLFTHSAVIRCFQAALRGKHPEDAPDIHTCGNTGVSCYEVKGDKFRIVYENDTTHLDSLPKPPRRNMPPLVWFQPMDLNREAQRYYKAREDAWREVYDSLHGFDGPGYLAEARREQEENPWAVQQVMWEEKPVGILQLAIHREAREGAGYISFLYLDPAYRRQGIGIQLIGQAVCTYRPMGRRRLQLSCAPNNAAAQHFYRRWGFQKVGQTAGSKAPLDLLEKPL